jgi:hypothetical protein
MRFNFNGNWYTLNMTPTVHSDYEHDGTNFFTVQNITIGGIAFGAGFSLFYSNQANAWVLEAIKRAIDYVMGKVTSMSFDMFGDFWKTEQKKSTEKSVTAYARSMDALNEVIKLEKNQRLNRTLSTFQTECRGLETAETLKQGQYNTAADAYNKSVTAQVSSVASGKHRERAYEGLFTAKEAAVFDAHTQAYDNVSQDDIAETTELLVKESLSTATSSELIANEPSKLQQELRFVAFMTMELDSVLRQGLSVNLGDSPTLQASLAYDRLATMAARNSVVKSIAAREVLNKYKKEHGGTGRNHAFQAMVDSTFYSDEWQQFIRNYVDPVPAAAEWVKVLGHRFEMIREEYRSNEEAMMILCTLLLNRLDSEFTRDVIARTLRNARGGV